MSVHADGCQPGPMIVSLFTGLLCQDESFCPCACPHSVPQSVLHIRSDVKYALRDRMWARARAEALILAQKAGEQGDNHWAGLAAIRMDRHPQPGDREFLLWAAQQWSV